MFTGFFYIIPLNKVINTPIHRQNTVFQVHKAIRINKIVSNQTLYVSYLTIHFTHNHHFCNSQRGKRYPF